MKKQTIETTAPITSAPVKSTKPAAGVMATNPATAPVEIPTSVDLRSMIQSMIAQVSAAVAAAMCVTRNALTDNPSAAKALPALKPYQPNHRKAAPITTNGMLWGGIA